MKDVEERFCRHIDCVELARPQSVWCGEHGIRWHGDPGLLEPLRTRSGRAVGDYRGIAKPGLLDSQGWFYD